MKVGDCIKIVCKCDLCREKARRYGIIKSIKGDNIHVRILESNEVIDYVKAELEEIDDAEANAVLL